MFNYFTKMGVKIDFTRVIGGIRFKGYLKCKKWRAGRSGLKIGKQDWESDIYEQ